MSIERQAISALKWATAAKVVVQIVSWAGTLVVVRLLSPQDYGLMAKVSVISGMAGVIAELGLGSAVVRTVDLTRDDLRKIAGVSLLFGAAMTAAVVAMAPLFAHLFNEPRLVWPIACASLQIMIGAVSIIPNALATRDLAFRRISQIEMVAGISSIAATLLLAYLGASVWALVLGALLGATVRSAGLIAFGERVSPLFSLRGITEPLKFGLTMVTNRISYFVVVQSDVLIGSAFLSTTEIGHYAVALQLATLPMSKVMGMINQITLPVVARQQGDLPRVREGLLKSLGFIALLAFPVLWGISALAPELVHVLFGSKWLEVVPALQILPLVVPVRMLASVIFTTALAFGNRELDLRNTILNSTLMPLGFFVGAHWGLLGLCSAWLVSVPVFYTITVPPVLRVTGLRGAELLRECGPPLVGGLVMYAAIVGLRVPFADAAPAVALAVLCIAGATVYLCAMALLSRRHLSVALSFARALSGRETPKRAG